ncbi:tetratricopeptide repeat protein [Vibrio ostreicida]|uniref:Tetratricopeptide repeat protein n=1 Tax=Vibrio ostreicida TaxID=526588 RepID=A0ABT8BZB5_9VIBR|nr:tetratricopeptide repeat protein [Vibrio ostreicida]MDN3612039.1 tetratricopeptide repeat protein [Vibrio ostreicida]NPD08788.1 tetratricopeptide repeat protein [Vibrio ostreicida]
MKNQAIKFGKAGEEFFTLLDGKLVEQELANLRKSKKVTITQLKSIFDLGVEFYNQFQFKEAEIVFSAYTSLNPYDHRGPGCLAAIYLEKGQFKQALDVLSVLKTYPTNELDETIINISLCHYKLNEHIQAAATLLIVKVENLNDFYTQRYEYLQQQLAPYLS